MVQSRSKCQERANIQKQVILEVALDNQRIKEKSRGKVSLYIFKLFRRLPSACPDQEIVLFIS